MADIDVVIDASAMVDLIIGAPTADAIAEHIADASLHAPAHLDLEVVSALARIHRAGARSADMVGEDIAFLETAPIKRLSPERGIAATMFVWPMPSTLN